MDFNNTENPLTRIILIAAPDFLVDMDKEKTKHDQKSSRTFTKERMNRGCVNAQEVEILRKINPNNYKTAARSMFLITVPAWSFNSSHSS